MSGRFTDLDDAAWDSPWRARAVRDKAVLAGGLLACALALPPLPGGVATGLVALGLTAGPGGVRARRLARILAGPATFIGLGAASVLFSVSWAGHGLAVDVTPQTVRSALTVLVRGLAATAAMLVLATTTPMVDLLGGLRRLRVPDACIEVASLTYRLVFVLLSTTATIHEAQSARLGYATRRTGLRSAGQAAAAIFLASWNRARRLEEGLAGRGYVDALRTLDPPRRASRRFLAVSLVAVAVLAGVSLLAAPLVPAVVA